MKDYQQIIKDHQLSERFVYRLCTGIDHLNPHYLLSNIPLDIIEQSVLEWYEELRKKRYKLLYETPHATLYN